LLITTQPNDKTREKGFLKPKEVTIMTRKGLNDAK